MTDLEQIIQMLDKTKAAYFKKETEDGGTILCQIDFYNVQGETAAPKLVYLNWQDTYTPEGKLISHDVIQKFCTLDDPTKEDD